MVELNKLLPLIRWSALSAYGRSPLVSSTSLVPLIGYLIIFSESIRGMLATDSRYNGVFSYDAKLQLIYFGLIAIFIFSIFYKIRCPDEIRKHSDSTIFISNSINFPPYYVDELMKKYAANSAIGYIKHTILAKHYDVLDGSRKYSRLFCASTLVFGIILLSIPSIDVFVRVLVIACHSLGIFWPSTR